MRELLCLTLLLGLRSVAGESIAGRVVTVTTAEVKRQRGGEEMLK